MYQPISFNVIRQALKHSGIPCPMLRELSMYKFPDGSITAEYVMTWTLAQIERYYAMPPRSLNPDNLATFAYIVQQSFAEDIQTTVPTDRPIQGMFSVIAHVRVEPRAAQLSIFQDGES
jgi:hypothetical protein